MPQQRKNVKRFKPVHNDSCLLIKMNVNRFKPVHTVSWFLLKKNINRFKPVQTDLRTLAHENATTTWKHKPVQTGSHRFMAFAKKNINPFKPVHTVSWLLHQKSINRFKLFQTDFSTLAHENATTTWKRKAFQTGSHRFMAFAKKI